LLRNDGAGCGRGSGLHDQESATKAQRNYDGNEQKQKRRRGAARARLNATEGETGGYLGLNPVEYGYAHRYVRN
jgi:hypothetical protein